MDWETTHPHRKLSGWHLILPPVSPMMWETSHLLTGSTLNSPKDLLLMNQFLWGISWLFFRSRVHASHPVSLSSSVLPAKSKVTGLPPNKGWWGMSLTHSLLLPLSPWSLHLHAWGLPVTHNTSPRSILLFFHSYLFLVTLLLLIILITILRLIINYNYLLLS